MERSGASAEIPIPRDPTNPAHAADFDERTWRRCALTFAALFVAGLLAVAALNVILDPYDSGRLLSILPPGVSDGSPRTANVSRGRDPNFNAAIFGNSFAQLIDPTRMTTATGLKFVQLTVPGTGPREQAALLNWFVRHHANADAAVLGIDEGWCGQDRNIALTNPFPFWLYRSTPEFLVHLLHSRTIALGWRRVQLVLGRLPRTDPAGYWDYETGQNWNFKFGTTDFPPVDLSPAAAGARDYPGLDLVMSEVAQMPPRAMLIVLMAPRYRSSLPQPGSDQQRDLRACKQEVIDRLARRPNSLFVDFLFDTPASRDSENFMDAGHYRGRVARTIEQRIVDELARLAPARNSN